MPRAKGQIEKVDFRGLKIQDIVHLVRFGEGENSDFFGGIRRLYSWLSQLNFEEDRLIDLTADEVGELLEQIDNFSEVIYGEIEQRIQNHDLEITRLETEIKERRFCSRAEPLKLRRELNELREMVHALTQLGNFFDCSYDSDLPEPSNEPFVTRSKALNLYLELSSRRGRIPFRKELESEACQLDVSPRALSKAIERMKLRVGDSRIQLQLEKAFASAKPTDLDAHLFVLRSIFESLTIQSPEAIRLRTDLQFSNFDQVLSLCSDERVHLFIEQGLLGVTGADGHGRMINQPQLSICLLQACRALSRIWVECSRLSLGISSFV